MIAVTATFENAFGKQVEQKCYFHLTKHDLTRMALENDGELSKRINTLMESKDNYEIYKTFRNIVLDAYCEVDEDGTHVRKSDDIRKNFEESLAFDQIVFSFLEDEDSGEKAANFVKALVPNDIAAKIDAPQS